MSTQKHRHANKHRVRDAERRRLFFQNSSELSVTLGRNKSTESWRGWQQKRDTSDSFGKEEFRKLKTGGDLTEVKKNIHA